MRIDVLLCCGFGTPECSPIRLFIPDSTGVNMMHRVSMVRKVQNLSMDGRFFFHPDPTPTPTDPSLQPSTLSGSLSHSCCWRPTYSVCASRGRSRMLCTEEAHHTSLRLTFLFGRREQVARVRRAWTLSAVAHPHSPASGRPRITGGFMYSHRIARGWTWGPTSDDPRRGPIGCGCRRTVTL